MRVISNTNIDYLYLYKNKINDFSQLLRIIYRTKLIQKEEEKNLRGSPYLYNLDLSKNDCYNKNIDKINLLKEAIDNTTLYCLDISHILYGNRPDNFIKDYYNKNYKDMIDILNEELNRKEKNYIKNIRDMNFNIVDKEKSKGFENERLFRQMDPKINVIINDEYINYPMYLKMKAKQLINENNDIKEQINNSENPKEEYIKIHENLIKYIKIKKANKNIIELQNKINGKKMIII